MSIETLFARFHKEIVQRVVFFFHVTWQEHVPIQVQVSGSFGGAAFSGGGVGSPLRPSRNAFGIFRSSRAHTGRSFGPRNSAPTITSSRTPGKPKMLAIKSIATGYSLGARGSIRISRFFSSWLLPPLRPGIRVWACLEWKPYQRQDCDWSSPLKLTSFQSPVFNKRGGLQF